MQFHGWIITSIGKVVINNVLGSTQNGLYVFANKFSVIVTLIGNVLNMAIIEETILMGKNNEISEKFEKMLETIFIQFIVLLMISVPLINIFYNFIQSTEFFASKIYVPMLIFYALILTMSTNMGAIFQAINRTKYIFITTLIGGIATVVIALSPLVKQCGIIAVIIAQITGTIIMLLMRYFFANKISGFKMKFKNIIITTLAYVIISVISYFSTIYLNVCIILLVLLIYIIKYKESLKGIIKKIKKKVI